MTTAWTWLFTRLHGEPAGSDAAGNRYYRRSRSWGPRREQRWGVYAGEAEASKGPPEWHGWLHYTTNPVPQAGAPGRARQKPPPPQLTRPPAAPPPAGHTPRGGHP